MKKKQIDVVAAVIQKGDKVFCFKKGVAKYEYLSGKFEFPGGKVEKNENPILALQREIKEELSVDVSIIKMLNKFCFDYPDFTVNMTSFICKTASTDFKLTEHIKVILEPIETLDRLPWLPADIPIVEALKAKANES